MVCRGVIDERQLATLLHVDAVDARARNQLAARAGDMNVAEEALRQREVDVDGRELIEHEKGGRVVRLDEIAGLHEDASDAARDRRADLREAELQLQSFEVGLLDFQGARRDALVGAHHVELVVRPALLGHRLEALHLRARLIDLRLVARDRRERLLDLGLDRTRIDVEQQIRRSTPPSPTDAVTS